MKNCHFSREARNRDFSSVKRELQINVRLWDVQRTIEHPAFLTTLPILRNLVKTVHFNLFIVHQLTVLTIFTLSDADTTARPLLSPSLVLQQS